MKKYFITAISCVIVCAIIGIVVYCCIPKTNELVVDAKDVSVKVGEEVKLKYSTSIADAVITFSVKDKNIAEVNTRGDDVFVTGLAEGSTTISVLARYKDSRFEESASIVVEKSSATHDTPSKDDTTTPDDTTPSTDDKPSDKPTVEPTDDNKPSDIPDSNIKEDELNITFVESNFVNFAINEDKITIYKNENAIFSIETNVNGSVDIESDSITASKITSLGNKTFSLYANEIGEYQITFVIDSTYRKTYTVNVI